MKKFLSDALTEAKTLPKGLWVAAIIVPGGLVTIGLYLTGKSVVKSFKKADTDQTTK